MDVEKAFGERILDSGFKYLRLLVNTVLECRQQNPHSELEKVYDSDALKDSIVTSFESSTILTFVSFYRALRIFKYITIVDGQFDAIVQLCSNVLHFYHGTYMECQNKFNSIIVFFLILYI